MVEGIVTSVDLIDRSIGDLQQLARDFAAELEVARPPRQLSPQQLRRKEALLTISVLLPKLNAVREFDSALLRESHNDIAEAEPQFPDYVRNGIPRI